MRIYKELEQCSEAWFAARLGKFTASKAATIAVNGKGLSTYAYQLAVERITGKPQNTFKGNIHTERGNEFEPVARIEYEMNTGNIVEEVGFVEMDEFTGGSPDGLVGDTGGLEIKCPDAIKYLKLLTGELPIDTDYIWQCQMNLLITGRAWWDLVYYHADFEEQKMLLTRIEPVSEMQERLTLGLEKGREIVKMYEEQYKLKIKN